MPNLIDNPYYQYLKELDAQYAQLTGNGAFLYVSVPGGPGERPRFVFQDQVRLGLPDALTYIKSLLATARQQHRKGKPVNKSQLIEDVATRLGTSRQNAAQAVEATLAAISDGVTLEATVSIPGFGTFTAKDVPAREVRNPATGEAMPKPATRRVGFKVGARLKSQVAGQVPTQSRAA